MTTTPYVVEIAPNRIRGGLGTFQAVWASVGGIICNIMLQVANAQYPDFYLLPIYVCWGLSAMILISITVIPESPWQLARHGKKAAAMRSMQRLYGGIDGYNVEEEYNIIVQTLAHERAELEAQKTVAWRDVLQGRNRVSASTEGSLLPAETHVDRDHFLLR